LQRRLALARQPWLALLLALCCTAAHTLGLAEAKLGPTASGVVKPQRSVDIAAKHQGRVVALHVEQGERVAAGAVLIELDAAELQAERAAAEAELGLARVERDWRARAADRLERLAQAESLSEDRLDEARYSVAAAEQRVKLATAQLAKIEALLAETRLTAPFAGLVVARSAELGQLTQPGVPLLRLEDHSSLELHVRVKELDLPRIQAGAPVQVRIDALGDTPLHGRVQAIIPSGDADHTFLVEIALPAVDGLYPGMFGKAGFGD
jgi:RND family efflux transporter MFP subunit